MNRLVGVVPLACWVVQAIRYRDEPVNLLWMCHIAALLLAGGLFAAYAPVIRVGAVWSLVGFPIWLIELATKGAHPASVVSHIVVPIVAVLALARVKGGKPTWVFAHCMLLFLFAQQLARVATAPKLNVNLAHAPYDGFTSMSYPVYWMMTTLAVAVLLFAVSFAANKLPDINIAMLAPSRMKPTKTKAAPAVEADEPPRAEPGFNMAPKISPTEAQAQAKEKALPSSPPTDPGFKVPPKMSPSEWRAAVAAGKASPIMVPVAEAPVERPPDAPPSPPMEALPRTKTRGGGLVVDRKKPVESKVPDDLLPRRK